MRRDVQSEQVLVPLPGARSELAFGDPPGAVVGQPDLARFGGGPLPLDDVRLDQGQPPLGLPLGGERIRRGPSKAIGTYVARLPATGRKFAHVAETSAAGLVPHQAARHSSARSCARVIGTTRLASMYASTAAGSKRTRRPTLT